MPNHFERGVRQDSSERLQKRHAYVAITNQTRMTLSAYHPDRLTHSAV